MPTDIWDIAGFKERFPEFDKTADAIVKRAAVIYDELYGQAFAGLQIQCEDYFVAHWLTINASDDVETAGVVTSKTVGPVSIAFGGGRNKTGGYGYGSFSGTKYGRRFVDLGATYDAGVYIA